MKGLDDRTKRLLAMVGASAALADMKADFEEGAKELGMDDKSIELGVAFMELAYLRGREASTKVA